MDPLTEEIEEHNNKQQGEGNGVVSMAIQLGDHHISLEKLEKLQTIGTLCHFFSFICAVLVWGHPDHHYWDTHCHQTSLLSRNSSHHIGDTYVRDYSHNHTSPFHHNRALSNYNYRHRYIWKSVSGET